MPVKGFICRDIMCMLRVCNQINFNLAYLIPHKFFSSYEMDLLSSFPVASQPAHRTAKALALFCKVRALRIKWFPEIMLQWWVSNQALAPAPSRLQFLAVKILGNKEFQGMARQLQGTCMIWEGIWAFFYSLVPPGSGGFLLIIAAFFFFFWWGKGVFLCSHCQFCLKNYTLIACTWEGPAACFLNL